MAQKRMPIKGLGADGLYSSQDDATPTHQLASKPADQLVKATFYLTPDLVLKLEEVRMQRLRAGTKIDKSALVREAIESLAI